MLRSEGIEADARIAGADVVVSMAYPVAGGATWTRKFHRTELQRAADALVAAAITLYPGCALAKVAEVISAGQRLSRDKL